MSRITFTGKHCSIDGRCSLVNITPTGWQVQVKIFEKYGCVFQRQKGSHLIFRHPNAKRAVVIPRHREVSVSIIRSNMKTVGMSVEEYLELAKNV